MKKIALTIALICFGFAASAQYKPTENDLGKDCATNNNKLGTWKKVTISEQVIGSNSQGTGYSNGVTSSAGVNANVGSEIGTKKAKVSANVSTNMSVQGSNTSSTTNTNTQTTTTTRTYEDIQCVEDKNANLPQMSPVRW